PSKPSGPTSLLRGKSASFSTNTTDPDIGDQVRFRFDWGDGTTSTWTGWVNSSQSAAKSKSWGSAGTYNVKAQAEDAHEARSNWSAALKVTVTSGGGGNRHPVANDDSASTNEGAAVWIDVLANDEDIDGTLNPETVTVTSDPSHGYTTANTTTGEIQYTPDPDFHGSDSFKYTVDDDHRATSNIATVTITVGGVKADASAGSPYYGLVGEEITFNGSLSYDPDPEGYIVAWYWDFGDGTNETGEVTTHSYVEAGTYTVILTVTDNDNTTDQDEFTVEIVKPNIPPTAPTVDGPTSGAIDTVYDYTAVSTDADNDTISYVFDWGDGSNLTVTGFLANGTMTTQNHSWIAAGQYIISVYATDNQTDSETTEYIVYIDVTAVDGIGYITDDDGDGIYDMFHDGISIDTDLGVEDDNYLIDSDGDGKWDHVFNLERGLSTYFLFVYRKYLKIYEETPKTPGFEVISFLAMLALVLIILRRRR
ncbi:MAG: PKD domain-containing protein, partial [Thermoplasmata archaeon]